MATVERTEQTSIEFKDNQITVKGDTFSVTIPIDTAKLASIYMTGSGQAETTISVEVTDTVAQVASENEVVQPKKRKKKVKTLAEVKASQPENKWEPNG